jgi:hypothetical protein
MGSVFKYVLTLHGNAHQFCEASAGRRRRDDGVGSLPASQRGGRLERPHRIAGECDPHIDVRELCKVSGTSGRGCRPHRSGAVLSEGG